MQNIRGLAKSVSARLESALDKVQTRLGKREYADEDDITSALLESLRDALDFRDLRVGVSVESKILKTTSKGKGAIETDTGADAVISVRLRAPRFDEKKGLLVQAKRLDERRPMLGGYSRLRTQCEEMRAHTNEAYVWLYGKRRIRSIKASTVLASNSADLDDFYTESPKRLLMDVVKCFRGDPGFAVEDLDELRGLLSRTGAKSGLFVTLSAEEKLSFFS